MPFRVHQLLESVGLCILPNMESFQPLFFKHFFISTLSFLFWVFNDTNVQSLIVPHVPEGSVHCFFQSSLSFVQIFVLCQLHPLLNLSNKYFSLFVFFNSVIFMWLCFNFCFFADIFYCLICETGELVIACRVIFMITALKSLSDNPIFHSSQCEHQFFFPTCCSFPGSGYLAVMLGYPGSNLHFLLLASSHPV